ncbi:acyl-coenzyme A thioesterase THEM5 isoform X3 [Sturnira hondurensis]|uniref:acyl-coenzyme A thioesterase THEM5 isoform X3 n=1 Tax=Sturnira hondurensis TaxID=192404 RepID=UPI0018796441|nr:acyl-coenzyme A thioesterase THEM5 isoform X3 [Sturnira hondurensis]
MFSCFFNKYFFLDSSQPCYVHTLALTASAPPQAQGGAKAPSTCGCFSTNLVLSGLLQWKVADETFCDRKGEACLRAGCAGPKVLLKSALTRGFLKTQAAALPTGPQSSAMIRRGLQGAARLSHHGALPGAPRILPRLSPASAFGSSTDSLVSKFCLERTDLKDYALPNASWCPDMLSLYQEFLEKTKADGWIKLPSFKSNRDHIQGLKLPSGLAVTSDPGLPEDMAVPLVSDGRLLGVEPGRPLVLSLTLCLTQASTPWC